MNKDATEIYYEFGPFRLDPVERTLKAGNVKVKLTHKPYDLLLLLLRCRERIVKREEITEALWAGIAVQPNNLSVNMTGIRNTLKGADPQSTEYIRTHPGEGYSFTAKVKEHGVPVTIAVLPFTAQGHQLLNSQIGLEMADTLTTKLNKNMSILVTPTATVNREYNGHQERDPLIFGHRLVVDYIFSGRIWQERDRIHVNVDFLNVRKAQCGASASFDGYHTGVFELDNKIYKWMESVLGLTPTIREIEQLTKQYTMNPKAYKHYQKGRLLRFKIDESPLRRAIHYFEQAIQEDPDFARAYANIAHTYIFMGMLNLITPQESYEGAKHAAHKARGKDETMASAHTACGFTSLLFEWEWEEAMESFERAVELNPNYAVAHMGKSHWFCAKGEFTDAVTEINHALVLDSHSFFINFVRGMVLFHARLYQQALEQFEWTDEVNHRLHFKSDLPPYGRSLAYEYLALTDESGQREEWFEKANAEARRAIVLSNRHPVKLMQRIHVNAMWGKRDKTLSLLDEVLELQRTGHYISQYHLGIVYASLEEVNLAIECLTKAHQDRNESLFLLRVDPRLNRLRLDTRFKKLLSLIMDKDQK